MVVIGENRDCIRRKAWICSSDLQQRGFCNIQLVMSYTNEKQPRLDTGNTAFSITDAQKAADTLKVLYPGIFRIKLRSRSLYGDTIFSIRVFTSPELGTVRIAHARSRNPFAAAMRIIDRIDNDPDFLTRANPAFAE